MKIILKIYDLPSRRIGVRETEQELSRVIMFDT